MLCHLPTSFNKGHCVATKECTSVNLKASIISPDDFLDYKNREESCSAFGSNLVCCELTKYASQMEPFNMMSSKSTTRAPIAASTVSITTTTIATIIKSATEKIEITTQTLSVPMEIGVKSPDLRDLTEHENFKLFDPKNCGKIFIKRVANGKYFNIIIIV